MSEVTPQQKAQNRPLYSLIAALGLVVIAVFALIFVPRDRDEMLVIIVGGIVSTIPSLLAALYAERTARDVRNGVVADKAREGAHKALQESGVTEVVDATQRGAATLTALSALTNLTESDAQKRDALAMLLAPHNPSQADSDTPTSV